MGAKISQIVSRNIQSIAIGNHTQPQKQLLGFGPILDEPWLGSYRLKISWYTGSKAKPFYILYSVLIQVRTICWFF